MKDDDDQLRRRSDPRIDQLTTDMTRVLCVIEGEQKFDTRGIALPGDGGILKEIKDIKVVVEGLHRQGNGGGGFSLRAKDKARITALFGFVVLIANVVRGIV